MKALFITADDLKRYSVLSGNLDVNKFMQYIEIAQDIHIQGYLGTDLYDKIQNLIITDTLDDIVNKCYHNPKRILRLNENLTDSPRVTPLFFQ